jgi:fatty-acyl-CoA synthase
MGIKSNRAIWEAESEGLKLIELTIGDLLDQQAAARPDSEAIVYAAPELRLDLRLTYREYRDEVNRLAKGLLALGIEKSEHVAVWATNVPEWLMLMMALAKNRSLPDAPSESGRSPGDRHARRFYGRRTVRARAAQTGGESR